MKNDAISIAKGIAIILMVMGHAQCPLWLWSYIYMFHMPLFFFFSGYCFKTAYLDNPVKFTKRRIIGIYWPYVKWGLVFLFMHNVFFYLNIYNDEYGFRGEVSHLYDIKEYVYRFMSIIIQMVGEEQLLGGYWFLHSLFWGSFIFFLILYICKRIHFSTIFGGIMVPLTMFLLYTGWRLPVFCIGSRETLASFFMLTGYWYNSNNFHFEDYKPWLMIPIYSVFVAIGTAFWSCDMFTITLITIIPYVLSALVGILMVFVFSKKLLLNSHIRRFFVFVGDNTLFILTWHFLSFKIISMLIIWIYSLPITRLAEFPVIEEYARYGWWLGYMIIGICLPTYVLFLRNRICKK